VAVEVPGTLLLAEAFWLMEGYFVRTLGMHRVYNSAFMIMMRDEDNAKYRSVIKNTLEFDPDIMKRYVNFMSNPDERTAIDQFGKGDKCFGVTVMMATLPGLPMFSHGQIEGFTEKYGMEYQRPRYDETPDPQMVARHEREIAPLLKRRWLFAESSNFLLYDFFYPSGFVCEDVFAYSNRVGGERGLVVYNNRFATAHGTIDFSAAYADKASAQLRQRRLGEGLDFRGDTGAVLTWRDSLTGLNYLRRAKDLAEHGLTLNLHAYQCYVFIDWRELHATAEYPWDRLCDHLNGRGVPNLDDALLNLELQPVHNALHRLLDTSVVRQLSGLTQQPRNVAGADRKQNRERREFLELAWIRCDAFVRAAQAVCQSGVGGAKRLTVDPASAGFLGPAFSERLQAAMCIPAVEALSPEPWTAAARRVLPSPSPQLAATAMWGPVLAWCALELLAQSIDVENPAPVALNLFDRLRLREPLAEAFDALGFEGEAGWRAAARIKVLLLAEAGVGAPGSKASEPVAGSETATASARAAAKEVPAAAPETGVSASAGAEGEASGEERVALAPGLWLDPDVRWLCGVHETEGHTYLVREPYEELLWWLLMPSLLRLAGEPAPSQAAAGQMRNTVEEALATAAAAGYRIDALLGGVDSETPAPDAAP
jgi:hypothetical protein